MSVKNNSSETRPWDSHYGPHTNAHLEALEYKSLPEMISKNSSLWAENNAYAMVLPNGIDSTLTYQKVDEYSDYFAVYLREVLKISKGDRVVIQMPNCLAYPISVFGILKAGGVIVNTNPLYTPSEMEHQFRDSQAEVLVIVDLFADKLKHVIPNTKIKHVVLVSLADFFPFLKKTIVQTVLKYVKKQVPVCEVHAKRLPDCLKEAKTLKEQLNFNVKSYWENIETADLCALQYTGGTTGVSKGAMLTHGNILANMYQILEMGKTKLDFGKETILTALPLYHIFAFTLNLMTFYKCGGTSVLIPNPRPLINMEKAFAKYPITWISGVNTLFNGLLNESWFTSRPPAHLKASIAGGTALHSAVAERWKNTLKTSVVEGFGLTETSPVVTFNPLDGLVKADTVGIPVPSTEVEFLDDNGQPVALGEAGEIAVKGPQVMKGYWNRPEETAKVFTKDGWLLTGDIGFMDKDGYIKIVDRKKDMILVSGFNVYPNEVEDCITKMTGVQEAAVIGIPNDQTGESVKAFVVRKDPLVTEEQVMAHCKQFLTHYKLPKLIEFRNELPKTPIGKILRKDLRKAG
jgi:long-chain acyl-CoA synthetase